MEKKRKMEKGKGEGLAAQACSASRPASAQQPSQPNHTSIRPALARGPARGPASPARPQLASSHCHLGPARQPRAAHPRASLSFARSHCHAGPARQPPHPQCHLLHANASTARRPNADSGDRGGPGGSRPGHDLVPLRRAHATTSNRQMQARTPITLNPHPPIVHAVAEALAIRAPAPEP